MSNIRLNGKHVLPRKYITVSTNDIIMQIATPTNMSGYTEGVLEAFLPDDDELARMTDEQAGRWIEDNNRRMMAICEFLNDNNL